MSKLDELLQKKRAILDPTGYNTYIDNLVPDLEPALKEFLDSFDYKSGNFAQTPENRLKLIELRKYLIDVLDKDYNVQLSSYLKRLDQVFEVNTSIQTTWGVKMSASEPEFLFARKLITDYATEFLSLPKLLDSSIRPGIQQILFRNVLGQTSRRVATNEITTYLLEDKTTSRYAKTLARDTMHNYDGVIQKRLLEKYPNLYDGFYYGGTIIETSRPQCKYWVEERGGFITFEQLKKDIVRFKDNSGYSDELQLTFDTFAVVRGGHNCRHDATPGKKPKN